MKFMNYMNDALLGTQKRVPFARTIIQDTTIGARRYIYIYLRQSQRCVCKVCHFVTYNTIVEYIDKLN